MAIIADIQPVLDEFQAKKKEYAGKAFVPARDGSDLHYKNDTFVTAATVMQYCIERLMAAPDVKSGEIIGHTMAGDMLVRCPACDAIIEV